ncbi:MAG: protein kinase [Actinomycetota bacterium]|nr:protein kinase [Actinomycetota bacterium]
MVEPGRRCLGDRYELHRLIAAGGMGQVWRGQDILLHRAVAVKVLRSEYTGDPTFLARFRAEAQHAASLSHPNIAAVFDYGEEIAQDGTGETLAYLVMELVEGEPLSTLVAREGPLTTETTLSLLRQTAFGLGEAHAAGMVHRDVKPGNILVRPDGSVKITDFGIAWSARSVALTRTGQVIGTPQYLSPEQAEGRPATPASDVYALGLIGYECLTGHPAFEGDNAVTIALKQVQQDPEPLPGDLPASVRELVRRALLKDPGARLPDGAAFVAAIDDVLAGRSLSDHPATVAVAPVLGGSTLVQGVDGPTNTSRSSRPVRSPRRPGSSGRGRRRVATVLLPLLALLAGAGIAVAVLQAFSQGQPASTASAAEQPEQPEQPDEPDQRSIVLDAADYTGRPVGEVTEQLTALGLEVSLREEVTAVTVPDLVTDVDPAGTPLAPADAVTVAYAVAPPQDGVGEGSGSGGEGPAGSAVTGAAVPDQAAPADEAPDGGADVPTAPAVTDAPAPAATQSATQPAEQSAIPPSKAPAKEPAKQSEKQSEKPAGGGRSAAPSSTPATTTSTAPSSSAAPSTSAGTPADPTG